MSGIPGDKIVERGDKNPEVTTLQNRLKELGYYDGAVDGIFGGGTELSVMDFQGDAGLRVDGSVGPKTRAALSDWNTKKADKPGKKSGADVVYKNQHATRDRPCTDYLAATLATAVFDVYGPRHQAHIYSGGQAKRGTPGKRTGSIRHDDYGEGGRALDAYIIDESGNRLSGEKLARLGQYWLAMRYGGCGLEMATGGIHDEWRDPPPGGGMYWTYPYSDGKPWGQTVRQMLVDGSNGIKP